MKDLYKEDAQLLNLKSIWKSPTLELLLSVERFDRDCTFLSQQFLDPLLK